MKFSATVIQAYIGRQRQWHAVLLYILLLTGFVDVPATPQQSSIESDIPTTIVDESHTRTRTASKKSPNKKNTENKYITCAEAKRSINLSRAEKMVLCADQKTSKVLGFLTYAVLFIAGLSAIILIISVISEKKCKENRKIPFDKVCKKCSTKISNKNFFVTGGFCEACYEKHKFG